MTATHVLGKFLPRSLQPGDKCFVITAARSHFSRDASEYFENFMEPLHPYGFHPRGKQRSHDSPPGPGEERWTPQTVIALGASNASVLVEDFLAQHRIVTDYYSTWFSNVFQKATGIDILSVPFDYEKKYSFIPGPQCSGIALRFEDATEWEGILRQFLPDFRMRAANRGGRKWYSEAYDNFKKKLVYNEAEERLMCATETQRHFYNEPGSRCFQRNFSSWTRKDGSASEGFVFMLYRGWRGRGGSCYMLGYVSLCVLCP